jgi:hypothetical protein
LMFSPASQANAASVSAVSAAPPVRPRRDSRSALDECACGRDEWGICSSSSRGRRVSGTPCFTSSCSGEALADSVARTSRPSMRPWSAMG